MNLEKSAKITMKDIRKIIDIMGHARINQYSLLLVNAPVHFGACIKGVEVVLAEFSRRAYPKNGRRDYDIMWEWVRTQLYQISNNPDYFHKAGSISTALYAADFFYMEVVALFDKFDF